MAVMSMVMLGTVLLCGIKSILGFRWGWEKCECCGKPWKDHH